MQQYSGNEEKEMRKYVTRILSIILTVALVCSLGIVSASAAFDAHVVGNGVNFRKGPSTSYAIMGAYYEGTPVTVLEEFDGWCKVTIFGVTGWMYGAYVRRGIRESEPITFDTSLQGTPGYVNTNNVNLRTGPGTGNASLGTLPLGTTVIILDYLSNGWYGVQVNGYPGFIFGDYLTEGTYTPGSDLIIPVALPSETTQYATTNGVVVRSSPNQSSSAVATLPIYTEVEIVTAYSNGWYGVTFTNLFGGGMSGYVYKEFLQASKPIQDDFLLTQTPVTPWTAYVVKDGAAFRVLPNEGAASMLSLKLNEPLTITAEWANSDGIVLWYTATYPNGVQGHVYASHVSDTVVNPNVLYIVPGYDFTGSPYATVVNTNNAPFYTIGGAIAGYLAYGTPVEVTAVYSNGFALVTIPAGPGYVDRYHIDLP